MFLCKESYWFSNIENDFQNQSSNEKFQKQYLIFFNETFYHYQINTFVD